MRKKLHIIYFSLASILTVAMLFCNLYTEFLPGGEIHKVRYVSVFFCLLMLIVSNIANIVIFALMKFGFVQARVCTFNAIFLTGLQLVLLFLYFTDGNSNIVYSPTILFPAIAAFLHLLAARRIMIDQVAYATARALNAQKKK